MAATPPGSEPAIFHASFWDSTLSDPGWRYRLALGIGASLLAWGFAVTLRLASGTVSTGIGLAAGGAAILALGLSVLPFQKIEFGISSSMIWLRGHAGYGLAYSRREGFSRDRLVNWRYTKATDNIIFVMGAEPVSQAILDLEPDMDALGRPEVYNMPVAWMNPDELQGLLRVLSQIRPGEMG